MGIYWVRVLPQGRGILADNSHIHMGLTDFGSFKIMNFDIFWV